MVRREGRAQAGHRAVKATLVEGNGIHISLGQNDAAQLCVFCQVQGKEIAAFIENHAIRGVEILWRPVSQHAAAKADHIPPQVDDGEHDPVTKAVVDRALLVAHGKTCVQQIPFVIPLLGHGLE